MEIDLGLTFLRCYGPIGQMTSEENIPSGTVTIAKWVGICLCLLLSLFLVLVLVFAPEPQRAANPLSVTFIGYTNNAWRGNWAVIVVTNNTPTHLLVRGTLEKRTSSAWSPTFTNVANAVCFAGAMTPKSQKLHAFKVADTNLVHRMSIYYELPKEGWSAIASRLNGLFEWRFSVYDKFHGNGGRSNTVLSPVLKVPDAPPS